MAVPGASGEPGAGAGPVSRRRAATQARLIAAAAEVFAERGFGRATVEDVCDRAGFTRGAFYSNFDSLDELFLALSASWGTALVGNVADTVTAAITDAAAAPLTLADVMDRVLGVLPAGRELHLLALELSAHALRHPTVAEALRRQRAALRSALVPIIRLGLEHAGVAVHERQLDDVARAVIAVNDGMSTQELLEPQNSALPGLRRDLLSIVLGGPR